MAGGKYISLDGLTYFWSKIKTMFALANHSHSLSALTGDANNRTVSDTEKTSWNGKLTGMTLTTLDSVNSNLATGIYLVQNVDIGTETHISYWMLETVQYPDPSYTVQTAYAYQNNQYGQAFMRTKDGGVWQPWQRIYTACQPPAMLSNAEIDAILV
jgi:hypothetical protein